MRKKTFVKEKGHAPPGEQGAHAVVVWQKECPKVAQRMSYLGYYMLYSWLCIQEVPFKGVLKMF